MKLLISEDGNKYNVHREKDNKLVAKVSKKIVEKHGGIDKIVARVTKRFKSVQVEMKAVAPAVVEAPAPAAPEAPAPVADAPAPVVDAPAPVVDAPAPVVDAPAPVVDAPAPVADAPTA